MVKTFMCYQGNKTRLLKQLLPLIPKKYNIYYEPMIGSGALFLALEPQHAVINDINKDVVNVWKSVKKHPKSLLNDLLELTELIKDLDKKGVKKVSDELFVEYKNTRSYYKKGLLYLFMRQVSFMNMFYPDKGVKQVGRMCNAISFSKPQKINSITKANKLLQDTKIYNKDYKQIIEKAQKGDFVYLDPPYIYDSVDIPLVYNKQGEQNILEDLKKHMDLLTDRGVYVMLSNSDYPIVRKTFKGYNIDNVKAYRGFRNVYENELVIRNYSI